MRLRDVKPAMFTAQASWSKRIVRMRVLKVQTNELMVDEVRRELLLTLATTQHGGKAVLKTMGFVDLEVMWARVPTLACVEQRERARGRLSKYSLRVFGASLLARPRVRIPMSNVFPRTVMVQAVKQLFFELGGDVRPVVRRLHKRARYVSADPTCVGDGLCNWRPWCRDDYVPGVEPACT